MKDADISFGEAVAAIDAGDISALGSLLAQHPDLVRERMLNGKKGYFKDPYLLWFVADNPIRVGKLPLNIVEITYLLVQIVKREAPGSYQYQLDYTLGLVATGRIPRECGVQIAMMDVLMDAGAIPGNGIAALANGNLAAAAHLIKRSGKATLVAAVCIDSLGDIAIMAAHANAKEKLIALTAAAFYGKAEKVKLLLEMGVESNGYPTKSSGFHSHATPLHQAVSSGSLESVKLLVAAGARLDMTDKIYNGTPLDWAVYMQNDALNDIAKTESLMRIEAYLKGMN